MPKNNYPAGSAVEGAPVLAIRKDSATALAGTDGDYIFLTTDEIGRLRTNSGINKTSFGEIQVAGLTPIVQVQFPYSIHAQIIEKRENNLGTITQSNGIASISSGASANSSAHMLTKIPLKYNPGQGAICRFTAIFTSGVTNSLQLAGIGEVGDGFFFGYNGEDFSILRRESGGPEIQTLSVTTGAVTGTGDITINLDGVSTTVAVISGDSARQVAVKIADADFSDTGLGWSPVVNNSTVIFKSWFDADKTGTFSLVDTDTTGTVGTFSETVAGSTTTDNFVSQSSWNVDVMDGTGSSKNPSGMLLDQTKGNVYQIQYQWLGFGMIKFFIENKITGEFSLVHRIQYSNTNTTTSLRNPSLPLHIMSENDSNTSDLVVKTSSMGGFIEGVESSDSIHFSKKGEETSLSTTELPILTIKNKIVYQSILNRVVISPSYVSFAADATKSIIVRIRTNPTLTGPVSFSDVDANNSVSSFDISSTGISGGEEIFSSVLSKTGSLVLDLHPLNFKIRPSETICITAEAVSGTGHDINVSLTWEELF